MNDELARLIEERFAILAKEFPLIAALIKRVELAPRNLGKNYLAVSELEWTSSGSGAGAGRGIIQFNPLFFGVDASVSRIVRIVREDAGTNFRPKDADELVSILDHEFAHFIEWWLERYQPEALDKKNQIERAALASKIYPSEYGANKEHWFEESFVAYRYSEKPQALPKPIRAVGELIDRLGRWMQTSGSSAGPMLQGKPTTVGGAAEAELELGSEVPSNEVEPEGEAAEEEIAAVIAALLGGVVAVATIEGLVVAIARLLTQLPGLPESGPVDDVTRRVSRLIVEGIPKLREGSREASATLRNTHIDNLIHRAHYAIAATKRVLGAEDVRKGFTAERRFFLQHRQAERTRTAGAKLNEAAAERWGNILSWNHTGKAKTHRPAHLAAHGKNYDVRRPPLSTGGVLPGQALHCDCVPGPPKANAKVLR